MFGLFRRAAAGAALLPSERAALKLFQGLGTAAFIAAAPIVAQALANPAHMDLSGTVNAAISAGAMAVLLAAQKWISAKGDSAGNAAPIPAPAAATATTSVTVSNATNGSAL